MRRVIVVVFVLVVASIGVRAQASLPAGQIVEKVQVLMTGQSYAAYLPSNYTPVKSWPTVFCLDPLARGKLALERFVKAAEKYGYIVVCSNNSRNGLEWNVVSQIFTDFWSDAHQRFNIDQTRTYAAGFSGGARLSSTFASRCRGCLAGVILAGASFPSDVKPDAKTPFSCYGIVGVDDFNWGEFIELEKSYRELTTPHHIETFNGGHEWPPEEKLDQALAWFTSQATKATTDVEKPFISRKEEKAEEELVRRQLREVGEIRSLWMKPPGPDDATSSRYEAKLRLSEWRKKKDAPEDTRERRLARRIISHLLVQSFETAQTGIQTKDYSLALANYGFARELDPKNFNVVYEIARMFALKRDKKSALEALEDAVELGFKDQTRLESEEAFSVLATEPRFQKLLASLRLGG